MGSVAFTGANLVDGERSAAADMTVVVDGNVITRVAPDGRVDLGAVDQAIDVSGLTIMPGMHMCHFHSSYFNPPVTGSGLGYGSRPSATPFGLEEPPALQAVRAVNSLRAVLLSGFTSVISAGAPYAIDASMKAAIDEGAIVGPRMIAGGRDLSSTGHSQHLTHKWWYQLNGDDGLVLVNSPDDARRAVREETWRGTEIIKLFVTGGHATSAASSTLELTRAEVAAAIGAAHDRGVMIRAHIANRTAIQWAIDLDLDLIDHADGLDHDAIEQLASKRIPVVPSQYFHHTFFTGPGSGTAGAAAMRADFDAAVPMILAANAAGVPMVLGDDFGTSVLPHGTENKELAFWVRDVGVPARDVIRWATKNGADAARAGDQLGTIAEGKLADLLIVDGDPIENINVLSDADNLVVIMKDGVTYKDDLAVRPTG